MDFPDSLRTSPPFPNKLYGDFGFSRISSVPTPLRHPPRTEEYCLSRILSVLHHLFQTSCTEILAFLPFPPYQLLPGTHYVRRNIGFPGFSPYSTTYSKQVVRRFWLFSHFLRTSNSLTSTTYGGISYFPILSVLHYLFQTSCTEILAFLSFPPYQRLTNTHHVRRFWLFTHFLRTNASLTPTTYGGIWLFTHFLRTHTSPAPLTSHKKSSIQRMKLFKFNIQLVISILARLNHMCFLYVCKLHIPDRSQHLRIRRSHVLKVPSGCKHLLDTLASYQISLNE